MFSVRAEKLSKRAGLLLILSLLVLVNLTEFTVAQTEATIPLLAVVQEGNNSFGEIATLNLEIREGGSGRVFVDTFPFTQVTTQISMRFAKQVACQESQIDCSSKDFIYTIRAQPGVVGGPSAGGIATVLTTALLRDLSIDPNIAMTGTINSGGYIGPVGGISEKVIAAKESGFTKVLIPEGTIDAVKENATESNEEINSRLGIEVIEIKSLDDAVKEITGFESQREFIVQNNPAYEATMQTLSQQLCNRAKRLINEQDEVQQNSLVTNLTRNADELASERRYYSAASVCFRANVILSQEKYAKMNLTEEESVAVAAALKESAEKFEEEIDAKEIRTITDLQAIMIVKERILEAQNELEPKTIQVSAENGTALTLQTNRVDSATLGFAEERLNSAKSWATFIGTQGNPYQLDNETVRASCINKIEEAEERSVYTRSVLPPELVSRDELEQAYQYLKEGRYELCLFQASLAKANDNLILGSIGVSSESIDKLVQTKLELAKRAVSKAQQKGTFPIIAFSYQEYAEYLAETDPFASMRFAEYAIELSNFEIYFEQQNGKTSQGEWATQLQKVHKRIPNHIRYLLVAGIGFIFGWFISRRIKANSKIRR